MNYKTLNGTQALEWAKSVQGVVAFDTETEYVENLPHAVTKVIRGNPNNYPFLFTFSTAEDNIAIPFNSENYEAIKHVMERTDIEKVAFNIKYDLHMCHNVGIHPVAPWHDVMIMHHLIDEEDPPPDWEATGVYDDDRFMPVRDLKGLAQKYLDPDAGKFESAVDTSRKEIAKERGVSKDSIPYSAVPDDIMHPYACADTRYTYDLFLLWGPEMRRQELLGVYAIEMQCMVACLNMERGGYRVDKEHLASLRDSLTLELEDRINAIYRLAGKQFNVSSAEELVEVFQSLGAEYVAVTEKGNYQTDEDALKPWLESPIEAVAELAREVLAYRGDYKILGTYVLGILDNISYYDKPLVRAELTQTFTVTGRMSCNNPNLQNLPRDDKRIRKAFVPESDDHILLFADYDGQEARIFLHYLNNEEINERVRNGLDIHTLVASMMFNVPYEEVPRDLRTKAKSITFGIMYGMGLKALADGLGLTSDASKTDEITVNYGRFSMRMSMHEKDLRDQASVYKRKYFAAMQGAQQLIKAVNSTGARRGFIFNPFGRRRRIKDQRTYRYLNSLIQSTGADILKTTLGRLNALFAGTKSRVLLPIHDEVHMSIHKDELHLIPQVKAAMEDFRFRLPMTVAMSWSDTSWADKRRMEELTDDRTF